MAQPRQRTSEEQAFGEWNTALGKLVAVPAAPPPPHPRSFMVKVSGHVPGPEQVRDPEPVLETPSVLVYSSVQWGNNSTCLVRLLQGLNLGPPKALLLSPLSRESRPAHAHGSGIIINILLFLPPVPLAR